MGAVLGRSVGTAEGIFVGWIVGTPVGVTVGVADGRMVGCDDGSTVGVSETRAGGVVLNSTQRAAYTSCRSPPCGLHPVVNPHVPLSASYSHPVPLLVTRNSHALAQAEAELAGQGAPFHDAMHA